MKKSKWLSLFKTFIFSGTLFAASTAFTFPSWTEFRLMTDAERAPLDQAVVEILKQVEAAPLSNGKIRFCVADSEVWETSPTASCESTRATAVRHGWPLTLTSASEPFAWIAYSRFLSEFCRANTDDSLCSKLGLGHAPSFKIENLDGASLRKSGDQNIFERISRILIPFALADVSEMPAFETTSPSVPVCKIQNGEMISKAGGKIFFDFGPQPVPAHSKLLTQIAVIAADKSVDETAVSDGLSKLNAMGKPLLNNFNTKSPWVNDRINKDQVRWIGVEKTEGELGDANGQKFAASFDQLKSQLKSRRTPTAKVQEALTVGVCPGVSPCAWLQNDKVRKAVTLVPLESQSLKSEQLSLERTAKGIFDTLESFVASKRLTPNEMTMLRREYTNLLLAVEIPTVATRNRLRRMFAVPDVSSAMVALVDGVIAMKNNILAQDRAIAETALARGGAGIVAVQNVRRDGIMAAFEDVCEGPKPAPPKAKAPTSKPVAKPASKPNAPVR